MFAWYYLYCFYFLLVLVWIDSVFYCVCSSFPLSFMWHNFSNLLDKLEKSHLDNYGWVNIFFLEHAGELHVIVLRRNGWVNIYILLWSESACGCYYFCLDDVLVSLSDGAPSFCSGKCIYLNSTVIAIFFAARNKLHYWKHFCLFLYSTINIENLCDLIQNIFVHLSF